MDDLNTKKWFVYLGDHHEGPFSIAEIQAKVQSGAVTQQHYVWAEGMADWQPMSDLPEFSSGSSNVAVNVAVPFEDSGASQLIPAEAMLEASQVETVDSTVAISFPGHDMATATDDKTRDLDPKDVERTKKDRKKSEKAAKEKTAAPTADPGAVKSAQLQALGLGGAPSARGGERTLPKILRVIGVVGMIAGGGYAYVEGYLNPVLEHSALRDAGTAVKNMVAPVNQALRPHLQSVAEQIPFFARFLSPLPALDDVAPAEYESLVQAATADLQGQGPTVMMALSNSEPFTPVFYLSSNLPDGAQFEIRIEGVSGTLLNTTSFKAKSAATVTEKLAKTAPIRSPGGGPIPRGEYVVYAFEKDTQTPEVRKFLAPMVPSTTSLPDGYPENRKLALKRTYFLGGPKDANYSARLKAYNDKLRSRATAEINDLKQFVMTLEAQAKSSRETFDRLRAGRNVRMAQANWKKFNGGWSKMSGQLKMSFDQWTVEKLKKDYFYGKLYYLTGRVGMVVFETHELRSRYFAERVNRTELLKKIESREAQSAAALGRIKESIETLESTPPSPTGMPPSI